MSRRLPKYVHGFIDRHGKARHYIRRPGFKQVALPGLPFSAEFMTAYAAALDGEAAPHIEIGASRTIPGTVNAIVAAYLASPTFRAGAAATQKMRRNILDGFRTQHGDKPLYHIRNGQRVMLLTAERLQRIVNEKSETPFQQRNILNSLRVMFAWAKSEGRIPDNPTIGVERMKVKTRGYPTWSEAEIERFEARYPIGTRERLALALLLYTGQRKGDVIRLGPTHIHRGMWMIDQGKTEDNETGYLEFPVHPELQAIIDATPTVGLKTFLVTMYGRPWTVNGFGNWFRDICDRAGCPDVSAHGLRKACARRLAEIGCSTHEIASITGHASLTEVQRYTKAADRKRLASSAMRKLVEGGNPEQKIGKPPT